MEKQYKRSVFLSVMFMILIVNLLIVPFNILTGLINISDSTGFLSSPLGLVYAIAIPLSAFIASKWVTNTKEITSKSLKNMHTRFDIYYTFFQLLSPFGMMLLAPQLLKDLPDIGPWIFFFLTISLNLMVAPPLISWTTFHFEKFSRTHNLRDTVLVTLQLKITFLIISFALGLIGLYITANKIQTVNLQLGRELPLGTMAAPVFIGIVALTTLVVLLRQINRIVLTPVKELTEQMNTISSGDFTPRVTVYAADELGALSWREYRNSKKYSYLYI